MKYLSLLITLVALGFVQPAFAATDVKNDATLGADLVSYWELEEESGTRADSYGANDLTDNNTVLYGTGIQGNAADCEAGSSEYLSITDASQSGLDLSGSFTISMWIKPESVQVQSSDPRPLAKMGSAGNYQYETVYYGNLTKLMVSANGSSYTADENSTTITAGNWYHLAFAFDAANGSSTRWVNGVRTGTGTNVPTSIYNGNGAFALCAWVGVGGTYHDGLIDEVGIWSKNMGTPSIVELYNSGSGIPYDAGGGGDPVVNATSSTPFIIRGGSLRIQGGTFKNTQL